MDGRAGNPTRPVTESFGHPRYLYVTVKGGQPGTGKQERRFHHWDLTVPTDSYEFLFSTNKGSKTFGQQSCIERLLERLVDTGPVKAD